MPEKVRLDQLLLERGLAGSREKARRTILAGQVLVNETPITKPGSLVDRTASLRFRSPPSPYVGRGGEKLAGALRDLDLDPRGRKALDIGASTGGFTDCLLQAGAAQITALDVGKGQLDWKLRSDPRVRVIEGVNARYLRKEDFPEPFDLVTIDVSFISLVKILPAVLPLLAEGGKVLSLVKPQFELGRSDVPPGGVVRDPRLHERALREVVEAARRLGFRPRDVRASRLPGLEGNREFFLLLESSEGAEEAGEAKDFDERIRRAAGGKD